MAQLLVIDDEPSVREVTRRTLEAAGHSVVTAENGEVGYEAFTAQPFDLVITDVLMPVREGVETVRAIRSISAVPIVVISGGGRLNAMGFLQIAEEFGATASLEKPFRLTELLEIVDRLVKLPLLKSLPVNLPP